MKNIQTRVMMSAVLIMSAVLTSSAAPGSEAQFDRLVKAYVLNLTAVRNYACRSS